jgi:prevent-host-death family protein
MQMAHRVGVRKLRDRLSEYLRRVRDGECLEVTDHGEPIALITPARKARGVDEGVLDMVQAGEAAWSGGKPRGAEKPVKLAGRPLSELALEDRR